MFQPLPSFDLPQGEGGVHVAPSGQGQGQRGDALRAVTGDEIGGFVGHGSMEWGFSEERCGPFAAAAGRGVSG